MLTTSARRTMEAIEIRLRERVPVPREVTDTESLSGQNEWNELIASFEAHRSTKGGHASTGSSGSSVSTNIQLCRPDNSLLQPPSPNSITRSCTKRLATKNLRFFRKATKCLPHFGQGSRCPDKKYTSLEGEVEASDIFADAGEVSTFASTVTASTAAATSQKRNETYSPLCWNELSFSKNESNCKIVISHTNTTSDCSSLGVSKATRDISGSTADASLSSESDHDSSIYMLEENFSDNDEGCYDTSGTSFETSALSPGRSSWVRFHELGCWCVD